MFGAPPLFAVGTGFSLVMGSSLINTLRHRDLGNVDFKLGLLMIVGTVPPCTRRNESTNNWKRPEWPGR